MRFVDNVCKSGDAILLAQQKEPKMETESVITNINSPENEPIAVIPTIGYARDLSREAAQPGVRRLADYDAWQADMAERRARAEEHEAKRRSAIKPKATAEDLQQQLGEAVSQLENGVDAHQATNGVNLPLIQARENYQIALAAFNEAKSVLDAEEAKGSLLDRLRNYVVQAERSLSALVSSYGELVTDQILSERFGQRVPREALSPGTKREIRYHVRIEKLREFFPKPSNALRDTDDEAQLIRRANDAHEKLEAVKQHIAAESAE
jgi:hypothetical protein